VRCVLYCLRPDCRGWQCAGRLQCHMLATPTHLIPVGPVVHLLRGGAIGALQMGGQEGEKAAQYGLAVTAPAFTSP
jgi:hypothetical protein